MNKPAEKYQDAEDARNVAILRERMTAEVEGLRESLAVWIEENTQHPIDAAVSIALLETAFDRYIDLLGATDAFEQTGRSLLSAKGRKVSQVAAITRLSRQIETRYETRGAMWQLKRRPGIRIQLLASPPFPYDFGQIVCGDPL